MAMSGGKDDGSPMMEMNMTPLIDVLLVLLIMFIITIPVATHSVDIDLPQPSDVTDVIVEPEKNKLILTQQDVILWNGNPITKGQLVTLLQQSMTIDPEPELQFEPEALASYQISAEVLDIIKRSGVTKFGFVGNERYRVFSSGGAQ
jgi:biopolymer transport protein ExbD